jgi:hypothetical protein
VNLENLQTAACFICQKHRGVIALPGGAIYEDHLVFTGHVRADLGPVYLGHLMAELKRHGADIMGAGRSGLVSWLLGIFVLKDEGS